LKVLEKKHELCTACHICEETCSQAFFKESNIEKSCIRIISNNSNTIVACNQCGVCIDICPAEAIYRDKNGIVRIRKNDCVGCLACVGFCPEEAMFYHDDYTEPFKCVSCGLCVKKCPTGAIFIEK